MIDSKIREKKMSHLFGVSTVPIPSTEPEWDDWGLMIYQRKSWRNNVYIPPRDGFDVDEAKRTLEGRLGLEMMGWKSLWYDPHSTEQVSYFSESSKKGSKP
ncbi:hypothetical protein FRC10_009866 [Ceratobasidium sp. 414]|nr:hypothetical protein FRC10_009866 [Ceratobasidium sp. 414]